MLFFAYIVEAGTIDVLQVHGQMAWSFRVGVLELALLMSCELTGTGLRLGPSCWRFRTWIIDILQVHGNVASSFRIGV
jgi:hypothetical protein